MYRHGDVLLKPVHKLPESVIVKKGPPILAKGEKTGHAHRIANANNVSLFSTSTELYLEVFEDNAFLVHEEHATIQLPKGYYRVWKQREYTPKAIRPVYD